MSLNFRVKKVEDTELYKTAKALGILDNPFIEDNDKGLSEYLTEHMLKKHR